ncbi:MAG: LamG-like jellyroll fold domain-containing protein, partial [Chloroflexota bacterium]
DFGKGVAKGAGAGAKIITTVIAEEIGNRIATTEEILNTRSSSSFIRHLATNEYLESLGAGPRGFIAGQKATLASLKSERLTQGIAIGATLALAGFSILAATGDIPQADKISAVLNFTNALYMANTIKSQVKNLVNISKTVGSVKNALNTLKNSSTKVGRAAGVVGLVITAAVATGFFIYSVVHGHIKFGSLAFDDALASLVATLIVAIILLAIAAIPVIGELIVAVIGLIDSLIAAICEIAGVTSDASATGGKKFARDYICGGITGAATKLVKFLIYDNTTIVDLQHDHRMTPTNISPNLSNPVKGFSVDNPLLLTSTMQITLYKHSIPISIGALYGWQYSDANVLESDFEYQYTTDNTTSLSDHLDVGDGQLNGQPWGTSDVPAFAEVDITSPALNFATGLNQTTTLYLTEGYAINAQECVMIPNPIGVPVPAVPVCWVRDTKDDQHYNFSNSFQFDIFPASLDDFYTVESRSQNSFALNWDDRFPILADADGDGLRSAYYHGNDPNDQMADTDMDGLNDFYEIKQGLDPAKIDSDDDGLTDYQEVQFGTNPLRPDSDNDGLKDSEEVVHTNSDGHPAGGWAYVYAFSGSATNSTPLSTWVSSDPLNPDTDGDGISDKFEQIYGFNPRVYSNLDVLSLSRQVGDSDGVVIPGQHIDLTTVVKNDLNNRVADFNLFTGVPDELTTFNRDIERSTVGANSQKVLHNTIVVESPLTASHVVSVTGQLEATIIDPSNALPHLQLDNAFPTMILDLELTGNPNGKLSETDYFTTLHQNGRDWKARFFLGTASYNSNVNGQSYTASCQVNAACTIDSFGRSLSSGNCIHNAPYSLTAKFNYNTTCPLIARHPNQRVGAINGFVKPEFGWSNIGSTDNNQTQLSVPQFSTNSSNVTLSAWARLSRTGWNPILSTPANLAMSFTADNKFYCKFGSSQISTADAYTDLLGWHHWACTYDGNSIAIYRDGLPVPTQNLQPGSFAGINNKELRIGAGQFGQGYFDGYLSNIKIFASALKANEINDLYWLAITAEDFPFDDVPHSYTFQNAVTGGEPLQRVENYTIFSGLPGRKNQSVAGSSDTILR